MKTDKINKLINYYLVGDSLLLPYEFLYKPLGIKRYSQSGFKQSLIGNFGITSDDSDHLLLTYQALLESSDINSFKKKLSGKLRTWLLTLPIGIGMTTLKSIIKLWLGFSPNKSGIDSAGNGPVMRIPIIAIYYDTNTHKRNQYIECSTKITHNNLEALAISKALGNFIAYLSVNGRLPNKEVLKSLLIQHDKKWNASVDLLIDSLDLPLEQFLENIKCQKFISGYILHTTLFALYVIYKSQDIKEATKTIIKASGDCDTIGALVFSCLSLLHTSDIKDIEQHYPLLNEKLINKNNPYFWILLKNLLSIPIVLSHGIYRVIAKINYDLFNKG